MFDLSGKTALVTGATGGIGEAVAKALWQQGASLTISGRRVDKLEALAGSFQSAKKNPDQAVFFESCDLADATAIENLANVAESKMGSVDILINNAGLTRDNLAIRMKEDEWSDVINTNLTGSFWLTQALLRGMMKRRYGRVISIASIVGVMGNAGQANYAASKAGLIGMTKSLAQEVASRGVTLNCIAPGFIVTAMTDQLKDEQKQALMTKIPAARLGTPEDIASAVIYLASDAASYVTGQTLHVNGGMIMI